MLEDCYPGSCIVEAGHGEEVVQAITSHPGFDLIVVDYGMPETSGEALVRWLRKAHPDTPLIVLSALEDPLRISRLLELGVTEFVPKSTSLAGIHRLLGRLLPLAPVAPTSGPRCPRFQGPAEVGDAAASALLGRLTQRQTEVLELMTLGKTNKDMSRVLEISENTIKVHVTAVLRTLGVQNRMQAVLMAQRLGVSFHGP